MNRRPWYTLGICVASLLIWLFPHAADSFIYDRPAILQGQLWRMFTGHFVHFSPSHLLYNLAAFALGGWLVERRTDSPRTLLFLASPVAISVTLLLVEPNMLAYAGLSGIVTALWVYLALDHARRPGVPRLVSATILTLYLGKIAFENRYAHPLFTHADPGTFQVATLSHLAGAAWSLSVFGAWNFIGHWILGIGHSLKHSPACPCYHPPAQP